ncbi:LD-carboxypeptidase [Acidobacteriota bacterium]
MAERRLCRPACPGSTVAVVAPSSPLKPELIALGIEELKRLGFQVKGPQDPGRKWRYLAGKDESRLEELRCALHDPEVAAIFCARGGHGIIRLLSHLDDNWFTRDPKIIVGASDATALLNFSALKCGVPAVHGPMPAQTLRQGPSAYDPLIMLKLLGDSEPAGILAPEGVEPLRKGKSDGILAGGCLSVLCSLIGTPFEPDTRGTILLLEDLGEKPYRIDRMLTQMRLAGWFEEIKGVVFGEMPDCVQHPDQGYALTDVILERFEGTRFPILFAFPTGHTRSRNLSLPLGVKAELDADQGRITILEPLVSA